MYFALYLCQQKEINMKVTHAKFGIGTVISTTKDTVMVNFNGETKELMKMYANLKNEDGSSFEGLETKEERVQRHKEANMFRSTSPSTSLLKSFL